MNAFLFETRVGEELILMWHSISPRTRASTSAQGSCEAQVEVKRDQTHTLTHSLAQGSCEAQALGEACLTVVSVT